MKCLYCQKDIKASASPEEKEHCWHNKCVKLFFGTDKMPVLDVTKEGLNQLAKKTVNKGLTVPGVQKKLSLHLSTEMESRLTLVDYPTGYILKPQTDEFEKLPEFEDLAMRLAAIAGIKTVPHGLVKIQDEYAYITRRIDRIIDEESVQMYAMEDFCQLSGRSTLDKYKASYEICGKIINMYSVNAGFDLSELYMRLVFSYIVGNSDMHLKNFSLIETVPASREFCLSQAYDLLPVNVIMPEDTEEMALTLNGKRKRLKQRDFLQFAAHCKIPEKSAKKMITRLCGLKDIFLAQCEDAYLTEEMKESLKALISARITAINS
ncbi:MAG: HipA domain-containing protein [Emergencia sp.]|nr:HipA domain-containing protein [Emergencia sp.]